MGQLALGLAGAGAGFMLGGPTGAQIGWLLGSFAWNLLDPPKIQGPRLQDTKVRGADYGQMRPILYGMARIGGIGMGQGSTSEGPNKFTEHEETSGGKGGPEVTNYRYTLSFANEICEGEIIGVVRRWANGRLITSESEPTSDLWPYVLYRGTTTQTADPTMELIYGAGEVTPMRGVAYEVVTEVDVADYGNARPNVEYEAFTAGGDIPWRVSSFTWTALNYNIRQAIRLPNGNVQIFASKGTGETITKVSEFQTDGTAVGTPYDSTLSGVQMNFWVHNLNVWNGRIGPSDAFWYTWDESLQSFVQGLDIATTYGSGVARVSGQCIYKNEYLYAVGGGTTVGMSTVRAIVRFECPNEVPLDFDNTFAPLDDNYSGSSVFFGTSDDDYVYVIAIDGSGDPSLWKFDADLTEVHHWSVADLAGTQLAGFESGNFMVYNGMVAINRSVGGGTYNITLTRINGDHTLTDVGVVLSHTNSPLWDLGGGLGLDTVGVFSLNPPPAAVILGDIVADLLERAGLTSAQYDVTDLTQEVRGFVIASQMTVRNAIDVLRKAFFFDVTEFDGKIVCVNRGHDAIDTIPDGDLAAHEPGSQPPEPLETTRAAEAELPRTVYINYYDVGHDYQPGSQYWRRTVTRSQSDVTLDLPIVFTATEALLRAQWHMHFAWLERDRFTFYTTRKWSALTPTDVVVVRGVNIRITSKVESPNGLIKFEGVRAFAGPYTSPLTDDGSSPASGGEVPGSGGGGQEPQEPPIARADTAVVLIDGPWTAESNSATAVRAAIYKEGSGTWPGGALYKSVDGGTTYAASASSGTGATVGSVATALGNFTGGNTVDEANSITVVLVSGTLESTTADGLANGLHLVALGSESAGWEFLQYQTATLTGTLTYKLTGLLRGRFGTEWAMSTHAANETLVLMASTVEVPGSFAELGLSRKYKPVTYGAALADVTAENFTNTGVALLALSPVLLGGGRDASANLTLNWTPRRRGSGGWPSGVDLPDTEPPEAYRVRIYTTSGYATVARTISVALATTTPYSAADQTTDFGSTQSTVYWDVAKLGTTGYGYATRGAT